MCLDLGKLEEKNLKNNFLSLFGLRKVKRKKIGRKNIRKTCDIIKKKNFLSNMRG